VTETARAEPTAVPVPHRRALPRWRDVSPLLSLQRPALGRQARVAQAQTIEDLRRAGRRATPRPVFDYVDGGAEDEISLRRSRDAFAEVEFRPRVLRDVAGASTETTLLGRPSALPLVLAPTGLTRLVHHDAETGVASAAETVGVPYTLSTMGTTSVEELRAARPQADLWFQLYVWRDRGLSQELSDRAIASGYSTLMLTVDVPVAGARLRDVRNGFTVPPSLSPRTLLDVGRHPTWWLNLLTAGPLGFSSLNASEGGIADLIQRMFDPSVTFDDLEWLRGVWPGSLVVKGIQRVDDAVRVVSAGADAVVLSNHGGRQLDRSTVPLLLLPEVRAALPDRAQVFLDGGVRTGADVAAALCSGADACLIGRAYLYGLMAGGTAGVHRVLDILARELVRTMQLLGVRQVSELGPDLVGARTPQV
jgi:L-lactate dehydrogenase (cytochrome)